MERVNKSNKRISCIVLLSFVCMVTLPSMAGADEEESDTEESDTQEEKTSDKEDNRSLFEKIGIRQLPPSAYPEPKVRGLEGGSMWLTFHGLQWPYMPKPGIGISGSVWEDVGYEKIEAGAELTPDITYWLQQGRFVLRVTPAYTLKNWFIQGQAEIVAINDQYSPRNTTDIIDTDDLWVRLGMWGRKYNNWDIQVGRYEAWELYHFGLGLDINTLERRGAWEDTNQPPAIYGVNYAYYRPSGVGNLAAHYYPTDFLRIEALLQYGNEAGLNTVAGRGAGILDFGWLKVKGGGEYKKQQSMKEDAKGGSDERGFGGSLQFVFDPWVEFGFNGAWGIADQLDINGNVNEEGSYTIYSVGGFLNVKIIKDLLLGGGVNYTNKWDIHEDENGDVGIFDHLQLYGAIQYRLFGQLYLKFVGAYAKADFDQSFSEEDPYANEMMSFRFRAMYLF